MTRIRLAQILSVGLPVVVVAASVCSGLFVVVVFPVLTLLAAVTVCGVADRERMRFGIVAGVVTAVLFWVAVVLLFWPQTFARTVSTMIFGLVAIAEGMLVGAAAAYLEQHNVADS